MTKVQNVREKKVEAENCAAAPDNRAMYYVRTGPFARVPFLVLFVCCPPVRDVPHSSSAMRGNVFRGSLPGNKISHVLIIR